MSSYRIPPSLLSLIWGIVDSLKLRTKCTKNAPFFKFECRLRCTYMYLYIGGGEMVKISWIHCTSPVWRRTSYLWLSAVWAWTSSTGWRQDCSGGLSCTCSRTAPCCSHSHTTTETTARSSQNLPRRSLTLRRLWTGMRRLTTSIFSWEPASPPWAAGRSGPWSPGLTCRGNISGMTAGELNYTAVLLLQLLQSCFSLSTSSCPGGPRESCEVWSGVRTETVWRCDGVTGVCVRPLSSGHSDWLTDTS